MSGRQLSWKKRATHVAVFLVCLLLGGAFAAVRWRAPEAAPQPVLLIDSGDLNLGTVWQQPELRVSLPIRNPSHRDVVVERLSASCNCTSVAPQAFRVPAGESRTVDLTIDLLKSIHDVGAPEDSFLVTLTAVVESPRSDSLQWPLHGVVRRSLHVSPPVINLQGANEIVQGVRSPTVTLDVTPQIEIAALKAEWTPSEADVVVEGPNAEGAYRLHYTPSQDLSRAPIDTRVTLRTRLADGNSGPALEVPVRGVVVGPVRLSPERLTFVDSINATSRQLSCSLIPLDGQTWTIIGVDDLPAWLSIDLEADEGGSVVVQLTDNSACDEEASLVVRARSPQGSEEKLDLTVALNHVPESQPAKPTGGVP